MAPVLFWIESWYQPSPPGLSYDLGAAAIGAAAAGMLGTMAGVAAGLACAVITAPVEWFGRPSRRFYTWLGVGVTTVLGSSFGVLFMLPGHPLGLGTVLWVALPICVSAFAAYWAGVWVWTKGLKAATGPGPDAVRPATSR